jgi:hypothetical protein
MRTTVELPDELLRQAKTLAASEGISLRNLFIEAVRLRLSPPRVKTRRPPPEIGSPDGPRIGVLSAEQLDEAMFG